MKRTARKSKHLLLALVLAAGFLFATSGTVYATEGIDNVEKSGDGTEAVSTARTASAADLTAGTIYAAATESVDYVEKRWDGTRVVSETKTEECTPITSDMENIGGEVPSWYVVKGDVTIDRRLVVWGVVNIILTDGSKLTVKDGISVLWDRTLNIYAQSDGESAGELICIADTNYNAAIGSNDNSGPNGPITIHGGKVTADAKTDGTDGAGIGGGNTGSGGTITIYGGTIDARGGNYAAGIGSGDADGSGRDGGTITIYGGDVTAVGGKDGAGIGGGEGANGGNVTIWGGKVSAIAGQGSSDTGAGIGSGDDDGGRASSGGTCTIHGGDVLARGGQNGAGIGGGDRCDGGKVTIDGGRVTAHGSYYGAGIGGGYYRSSGDVTIAEGSKVTVFCGNYGAGIGGGYGGGIGNGKRVQITGGHVEVSVGGAYDSPSFSGAGIGGGSGSKQGGDVIIEGGNVSAESWNGAGIGGGGDPAGIGGNVTISGGTVAATSRTGAGIGGGGNGGSYYDTKTNFPRGGNVTISGGGVFASSTGGGAAIGGGMGGDGGSLTITDGYVVAITSPVKYDWTDHYAYKQTGSNYNAAMASVIGSLLMKALVSHPVDRGAAAIGGGFAPTAGKGGAAGYFKITGGTLIAKSGRAQTNAIGPADLNEAEDPVTNYVYNSDMWVSCSDKVDDSVTPFELKPVKAANRGQAILDKPYVMIEKCPHASMTYSADSAFPNCHDYSCEYCGKSGSVNHNWVGATYSWNSDYSTVTASHHCADCGTIDSVVVKTDHWEKPYATCTTPGTMNYMADFSEKPGFDSQYKTVEIPSLGHQWGEVGRIEGQDICGGTAITKKCKHCSATKTEGIANHDWNEEEWVTLFEPTCTEQGERYHKCNKCDALNLDSPDLVNALGHEWGGPTYEWADDKKTVTAKRVCTRKGCDCIEEEEAAVVQQITKAPTCTEPGKMKYTADFSEKPGFESQSKTVEIPSLGHQWGEAEVIEAEDIEGQDICHGSTVKKCTCSRCNAIKIGETEEASVHDWDTESWIYFVEPTCTGQGERYHKCKNCDALNLDSLERVGSLGGHVWGEPTYKWAENKETVTAKRVCTREGCDCIEEEEAAVVQQITKAPTCTEDGEYILCVEFLNDAFERQEGEATTIPAYEHKWGEPTYVWSEDNSSVTADRYCTYNPTHLDTETVGTTSEVIKEPTQEADGERVYTSDAFANSAFAVQIKTVAIPKLNPQPGNRIFYSISSGDGTQWTKGSSVTADFTFKRSVDDSVTFSHFAGIQVDGKDVDAANYTAESGSVVVKLKPAYLETLDVGEHVLTALFDDADKADASFKVLEAPKAPATEAGDAKADATKTAGAKAAGAKANATSAKTGDATPVALLAQLAALSAAALLAALVATRPRRSEHADKHAHR